MNRTNKASLPSSRPKTPALNTTAPKTTLPTRQSVSTVKPKVVTQKEVPKVKVASKTPVKTKIEDKNAKLPVKQDPVIIPEPIEVIEESEDNVEDNGEKKIPKMLYHKPSFSCSKFFI